MDHKKKQLIVFAEDWGGIPSSSQHLAKELLVLGWQIIWVNSIGLRKPSFNWPYLKRLYQKLCHFLGKGRHCSTDLIPNNLTIIHPLVFPFFGISIIDKINRYILRYQLHHVHKNLETEPLLFWAAFPTAYPYHDLFKNKGIIYYCGDDFPALSNIEPHKISILENRLIDAAQLIIVPSDVLLKKMPQEKTLFLDQGVDVELFEKKYDRPKDLPEGKPIAGFFGCLSSWVDIHLILQCAQKLKNWNFVIIGPSEVDISLFQTLDNLFYLGAKPYQKIPAYAQHWNVSLLPFVQNQLTKACNPLKIKEYLISGKPVVSMTLPALETFKPYISLCNNAGEFINAIPQALNDQEDLISKRIAWVKKWSWAEQAKHLEDALLPVLRSLYP